MPIEEHPPTERLTPVDQLPNGEIVQYPTTVQELQDAYAFLQDKFVDDAVAFEMNLDNIENIKGIYKINLANENFSKDVAIQIIINSNGKDIILEYTALAEDFKDGFNIDVNTNETNAILSLASNLSNCYPSNVIEQDEQKIELAEKIKEITGADVIVGDPIIYSENAVLNEYQIPIYKGNSGCLYSIKESVLAEHSEDINFDAVMSLLADYIEGKNDFFEVKTIEQIEEANYIYNAIDSASEENNN